MRRRRPFLAFAIAVGVVALARPEIAHAHHPQGDGWSPSLILLVVAAVTFAAVWLLAGFGGRRGSAEEDAEPEDAPEGEQDDPERAHDGRPGGEVERR